jgi:hypothetical protein
VGSRKLRYEKDYYAIACLSGGLGSFLSAYLYKKNNPNKKVIGYFTDVKNEDLDTYRFLVEGAEYLDIELIRDCDGRDIWDVFEDRSYQGNNRVPICSLILKIQQRVNWLKENCEAGIDLVIGFDWSEIHRVERAIEKEKFANIIAPLVNDLRDKKDVYEELKNPPELPELYEMGFPHANCGGACVQAGLGQWELLLRKRPERYAYHEIRQEGLMRKNKNIRPFLRQSKKGIDRYLSLREYRQYIEKRAFSYQLILAVDVDVLLNNLVFLLQLWEIEK